MGAIPSRPDDILGGIERTARGGCRPLDADGAVGRDHYDRVSPVCAWQECRRQFNPPECIVTLLSIPGGPRDKTEEGADLTEATIQGVGRTQPATRETPTPG